MRNIPSAMLAVLALTGAYCPVQAQTALTPEQGRAIVAPFYQGLNAGNDTVALISQVTSPDWVSCGNNEDCKPRNKVLPMIAGFGKAIPDLKWEIKEVLTSANRIIVRGEATGTPAMDFMGVPKGGKGFKIMSIDIHTVENGKLVRAYHLEDWMSAVQQLSAK